MYCVNTSFKCFSFFCIAAIVQVASRPTTKVPIPSLELILSLRVGTRLSSQAMGNNSRAAMGRHSHLSSTSKAHLLPTPLRGTVLMDNLSTASRVHHKTITTSKALIVRVLSLFFTVLVFLFIF